MPAQLPASDLERYPRLGKFLEIQHELFSIKTSGATKKSLVDGLGLAILG
jgi:hypothetical protein